MPTLGVHLSDERAGEYASMSWSLSPPVETDRGKTWGIDAWVEGPQMRGRCRIAEIFSIEADAHLMAAARDYDACMTYIDTYLPNDDDLRHMADDDLVTVKITAERAREIRAAIAKAEGR